MHCKICDGMLKWLGCLGNLVWLRCEDCGMDQSKAAEDMAEMLTELEGE